jgi:Protein of unknown function (DUF2934)
MVEQKDKTGLGTDSGLGIVRSADIQRLAYEFWQKRGCPFGTPEVDWFRAEHECRERHRNFSEQSAILAAAKTVGSALGSATARVSSLTGLQPTTKASQA